MRLLLMLIPLALAALLAAGSARAETNVTLVSPANGNVSYVTTGHTAYGFNCSASDAVQLANFSLWINSTGAWAQNQTQNVTGLWNYSSFPLNLGPGDYMWNCLVGDNSSNYTFYPQNWTVTVINITDVTPPSVSLNYPDDENSSSTITYINYTFNCSASDGVQLANISLWINSTGAWHENQTQNATGVWNFSIFNLSLGPGYYVWNCRSGDNSSNYNFSSQNRTISISVADVTPPGLWFTSPAGNGTIMNITWIFVNVSANEDLNTSLLEWYNGSWQNMSMNVSGSSSWINMSGLQDWSYYFRVYANDSAGNWNVTEDRQVSVDATYPVINITSPLNWTNYSTTNLTLNFTYNESNPHTCWYVYNGSNVTLENCTGTSFTALDHQQSFLFVWMNDTTGNVNASEIIFSVCTESWTCAAWSGCSGSVQGRTCTDSYACGTFDNRPALSQACEVPGGGGGGGGGEPTVELPQVNKTWEKLEPGAEVSMSINKSGLEFSEIRITVNSLVSNISISVTKLEGKPADVQQVSGKVYQYVSVAAANLSQDSLNSTKIRFRVAKSWISQNSIDKNRVYLNRYENSVWARLNTTYQGEDSQSAYYLAETPGFSYFVITGDIMASVENETQACNNNTICDAGEDEANCPADCMPHKQCEAGMFMCRGSVLDGCSQERTWIVFKECENGCLNAKCLGPPPQPLRVDAVLIIIAAGAVAIVLELFLWRKRYSPWRYFRI